MRKCTLFILLAAVFASTASAAFKLPRQVFGIDKLADAQAEAKKEGKAVAFLYSDTTGT